jgi:hypothetical protein
MNTRFGLLFVLFFTFFCSLKPISAQNALPQTGISGLYEVVLSTVTPDYDLRYFAEFGFRITDSAQLTADEAFRVYGVRSAVKSYRLQNGDIDSHGLLRLMVWAKPTGAGVSYSAPETIGRRIAVMNCRDIWRLTDVFRLEKQNGKKFFITEPTFDVIYKSSKTDNPDFFNRQVGVRENGVYTENFAHVFFQRYGYDVPGYGTISNESPLGTSEFTHHSFIVRGDSNSIRYLTQALGLKQEAPVVLDGDWQRGPKAVFHMPDGYAHQYVGFVSPNNICGKLKFFFPQQPVPDHSEAQKIGALGMSMHTFFTPQLSLVHKLVGEQGIVPSKIEKNEFGERAFVFTASDGVSWQILEKTTTKNKPTIQFQLLRTGK